MSEKPNDRPDDVQAQIAVLNALIASLAREVEDVKNFLASLPKSREGRPRVME